MNRFPSILLVTILLLISFCMVSGPPAILETQDSQLSEPMISLSEVTGSGDHRDAILYFDRTLSNQQLKILNSYSDTEDHSAFLDLSPYLIPGWTLYNVTIDISSINAAVEKEVVGVTYENYNFAVIESLGTFYSQIAQGFYNQPHDGALVDYSVYYSTSYYNPNLRGNASYVVRSNYQTSSAITTPMNMTGSDSVFIWATIPGENASLSANTVYWAVIDGSLLMKAGDPVPRYPIIYWGSENSAGLFASYQKGTTAWDLKILEALFRYSYLPWNQTAGSPIAYSAPSQVDLAVNSSAITTSTFSFSSKTDNITNLIFETNQSVYFNFDLTLSYTKTSTAVPQWVVKSSGGIVEWNTTVSLSYPLVSGLLQRFLNLSKASSWIVTGLYNSSMPSINYDHYTEFGTIIKCSEMNDETWTLKTTSFNHLTEIHLYNSLDDSEQIGPINILTNSDINLTLREQDYDPVMTGFTSLVLFKGESSIWTPSDIEVTSGYVSYFWNIDSTTDENGAYALEVSWSNGTDAGYITRDVVVYYPTTFTPSSADIDAFTEDSFEIRVYFEDSFTPQGLDGSFAAVIYSFDGSANASMIDLNNGTWTAQISTIGKIPGGYYVQVYAEGFALENQSLLITTTLIHDTQELEIQWTNTNDISYVESTELHVIYRRIGGSPIQDATVTVTIDTTSLPLKWDSDLELYKITFNGTSPVPGMGVHGLLIEASRTGYKSQSDSTKTLTISEESTSLTISWSNGNSITFVESTILYVDYLMSNSTPIPEAVVNVTIGSDFRILTWSVSLQKYWIQIEGNNIPPGLGVHTVIVRADRFGYEFRTDSSSTLTIEEEPTTLSITWSDGNSITYVESTTLIANYTMSNGSPVTGATIQVTISSGSWIMIYNGGHGVYELAIYGSDALPDFGTHSVTIEANRSGFVSRLNSTQTFTKSIESTSMFISWSNGNNITFIGQTVLIVSFRMSNNSPIEKAIVNVTINGIRWDLTWHPSTETYRVTFYGSDNPPGFGVHALNICAWRYGFEGQLDNSKTLILTEEPTTLTVSWSNSTLITYIESTTLIVEYRMSDTTPISGAIVNVTISGTNILLSWHMGSQTYRHTFSGSDNPPGFGLHSIVIQGDRFGFQYRIDNTQTLTITEEPSSIDISWVNSNTITYVQSTYLVVNFTNSNGLPIIGATVNATIDGLFVELQWESGTETYRALISGTNNPPGFGTHTILILAGLFGYESKSDNSQSLTIQVEPTSIAINWLPDNDITFVTYSILSVSYRMSDSTPISGAFVNATIAGTIFVLEWDAANHDYRIQLKGSDNPPGLGTHSVIIQASLKGFAPQSDSSETVILRVEPTTLTIDWSNGNDLDFFEHTYLFVDYRMSNLTTIRDAILSVTINGNIWLMTWNNTEGKYQVRFEGSDVPPGVGTHSLTISVSKFGYQDQSDSSQTLTLPVIPTALLIEWTNGDDISYVQVTILRVSYRMFNGTVIVGATLNVSTGSNIWSLVWNEMNQAYEHTFSGNDVPPGIGTHPLTIFASKPDFKDQIDFSRTLTIKIESTTLNITWTNGNDITYFGQTTLSVSYLMSDATPITLAIVNVTIGGGFWELVWNPLSEAYEITIRGSDNPPGIGNHSVAIKASLYGFEPQIDISQEVSIRLEDTIITFEWVSSNTITYVEKTTLRIFYQLANSTPIPGATVNVTLVTMWIAEYNPTSGAYEVHFKGTDEQPGLGIHTFVIKAWKYHYQAHVDISQTLTIVVEPTSFGISWTNGNDITYAESTTLLVNFTMSNGTEIDEALVEVTINSVSWPLTWDSVLELYKITFSESGPWPGLGTHGLRISGYRPGYETAYDTSQTLRIRGEMGDIESYWLGDGIITYVESVTLVVNYTLVDGTPIVEAIVNVTVNQVLFDLVWHPASETYRITFNGSDSVPGFGTFGLEIRAWRYGYDGLIDSTRTLSIIKEPTSFVILWSNTNNISYFDHTNLFVRYIMSDSTDILSAIVNVTINGNLWILSWNATQGAYGVLFEGSDIPPGFGMHSLTIRASSYGFAYAEDSSQTLMISKDPSSIEITWTNGNDITFVESTQLIVYYRMSNSSPISTGTLNVTIGSNLWELLWNDTLQGYVTEFSGNMDPPSFGSFALSIHASGPYYASHIVLTSLSVSKEPTVAIASWITFSIDWTQSVVLGIEYRDSYHRVIPDATQKTLLVDGIPYILLGNNGTYWFEFDNSFDLGLHYVTVNLSKYGYEFAVNSSISFSITLANTNLVLSWSATTIDYLGLIGLEVDYIYVGTGLAVPVGEVTANITINGMNVIPLLLSGDLWIINLNGQNLDLGIHSVLIRAQAYGYMYLEVSDTLTVNEVSTNPLSVSWTPINKTIQYTDNITLTVEYTYYGGDVPNNASVSVSINGHIYGLEYVAGTWTVSIQGSDLGIGIYEAEVIASLYGYLTREHTTTSINITLAANSFLVTWEPSNRTPTYIDRVNVTVIYTQDFQPILEATVRLYINGTVYDFLYHESSKTWYLSIQASTIDLGIWNVTITANKTGYTQGYYFDVLQVIRAPTLMNVIVSSDTIYFDESATVDIFYQMMNLSTVPNAIISFTLEDIEQQVIWNGDSWRASLDGAALGVGIYEFTIVVSSYGYETQIDHFNIAVLRIPTSVISNDSLIIHAREETGFTFICIDTRTSMPLFSTYYTNWEGEFELDILPNGTILVSIGQGILHVGNYTFEITFVQTGYENATGSVIIQVLPIPMELEYSSLLTQYENETISIDILLKNALNESPVDWGEIIIEFGSVPLYATYIESSQVYNIIIWLNPSFDPGEYQLLITATAADCISEQGEFTLKILPKTAYHIQASSEDEIIAGENIIIAINVTENDQPIDNIQISVQITITLEGGEIQVILQTYTTNSEGKVLISLDIPINAEKIEIVAYYDGSISEWPVESEPLLLIVLPPDADSSIPLFEDPLILSIIVGGISLPLIGFGLRARRRGSIKSTEALRASSTINIPDTTTAPVELIEQLRKEIMSSDSGFTRAELSQRIGSSSSKIGAVVKDLLDSDSNFHEAREGSRRIIRYRKPE